MGKSQSTSSKSKGSYSMGKSQSSSSKSTKSKGSRQSSRVLVVFQRKPKDPRQSFHMFNREESRDFGKASFLSTLAICFLFIVIVFDVDDPIEIYDYFVGIIKLYSKSVSWIKELWSMIFGKGWLVWLLEKIFGVSIDYSSFSIFDFLFGWIKKI